MEICNAMKMCVHRLGLWQKAGLIFRFRVFHFISNLPGEFVVNEGRSLSSAGHHISITYMDNLVLTQDTHSEMIFICQMAVWSLQKQRQPLCY